MLSSDAWLEQQLTTELSQSTDLEKLVKLEQLKISKATLRISKVQEGWEKGFYTPEEVQIKLTEHREVIARAESEISRLREQMSNRGISIFEAELLRQDSRNCATKICKNQPSKRGQTWLPSSESGFCRQRT